MSCWLSTPPPGKISPVTRIGTSIVTFSPLRTRIRSTCSMTFLTGSRCTALGRAISLPFARPSRRSSTFGVRSARIRACPGTLRGKVSVPCPYSPAGTRPSRRVRRAAPLPNSSRASAAIFTSGTVSLLSSTCNAHAEGSRPRPCPYPTLLKPSHRPQRQKEDPEASRPGADDGKPHRRSHADERTESATEQAAEQAAERHDSPNDPARRGVHLGAQLRRAPRLPVR